MTALNPDIVKLAIGITFFLLFLEEVLGYYPFGHDPRTMQDLAWDENAVTQMTPKVEGDEHIKYYRGNNIYDMSYLGAPTSKTADAK